MSECLQVALEEFELLGTDDDDKPDAYQALLDAISDGSLPPLARITQEEIAQQMTEMPDNILRVLKQPGLQIFVGKRADDTPGWAATGIQSSDVTADGRSKGSLSFYTARENMIFISTDEPGGSKNVMVHEMGHALDFTIVKDNPVMVESAPGIDITVSRISRDDPEWVKMHDDYLLPVKDVNEWFNYFIGGPSGTNNEMGRAELFAEGLAAYFNGNHAEGKTRLRNFLFNGIKDTDKRRIVAEKMIDIWKRYKIIE